MSSASPLLASPSGMCTWRFSLLWRVWYGIPLIPTLGEYGTLVHDDQDNLVETDYVERIRDVYAAGNSEWNFDNMGTEDDPTSENAVLGAAHGEREENTEDAKL